MIGGGDLKMIHAVVPVKDEVLEVSKTLQMLLSTLCDKIVVVLNGCDDNSLKLVESHKSKRIDYIYFNKALGVDIPRVIGAHMALMENTKGVVFVDGDMKQGIEKQINHIVLSLRKEKCHMALTNCYNSIMNLSSTAKLHLYYRKLLNMELGLFEKIGYSIPSHGPHGISRRLLDNLDLRELAIPPVSMALGAKKGYLIDVVTSIPVSSLPTTTRDEYHAHQIVKTLIGDCIEAIQAFKGQERSRSYHGKVFTGYHKNRRFDILEEYLSLF